MNAFTIIVLIFVVVLIVYAFKYSFYSQNNLTSMQSAQTASIISSSSLPNNATGSAPTNFTYSAWIYINNWNYRYGEPKVILGRMGGGSSSPASSGIDGLFGATPCPVLALGAVENTVTCALSCYAGLQGDGSGVDASGSKTVVHTCVLRNVPIQSWVQLAVVVNNMTLDFYMNGKIVRTCILPGPAYIDSTANLNITPNGGFDGYTANVQYWAAPKNPQEVYNIYEKGWGGSLFGNLFNSYGVQISLTENGVSQGSVSI